MPNNVDRFFQSLISLFENNKLPEITDLFTFPMPVFVKGKIMLLANPDTSLRAISSYHDTLSVAGWTHSVIRVVAQSLVVKNQMSVWIERKHLDAKEQILSGSSARYFCTVLNGHIAKLEMIEFLDAPDGSVTDKWPLIAA